MSELSAEEIVATWRRRQAARAPFTQAAEIILAHYEGRTKVNLPELDDTEHVAVANLMATAVDQSGARIASTEPMVMFHPTKPDSKTAQRMARERGQAMRGLTAKNRLKLKRRQRSRHLIAYGTAPVVLRPWRGSVVWQVRSPLATFESPMAELDDMIPDDCIFTHQQSWYWLRTTFPEQSAMLKRDKNTRDDDMFTLLEYVCHDEWVLIAVARDDVSFTTISNPGATSPQRRRGDYPSIDRVSTSGNMQASSSYGTNTCIELLRTPNLAGRCPVVIPSRIGLEGPSGQFNQMVYLFQEAATIMALEKNAIIESIYPQQWTVQRQGEQMEVVATPDSRIGRMGEIRGGDVVTVQVNPGFQTYQTLDRLERAQRINGGVPSEFGGESGDNIRTGRRGDQVLSSVIDFPIQEAQELLAQSQQYEEELAIDILRKHYPNTEQDFGVVWRGRGSPTWVPSKLFPDDRSKVHDVRYPFPGSDLNGQTIRAGQKLGLKEMSLQTIRENDPEIDDPELERDRVTVEQLEAAMLASLQQQAASGAIPPADYARIMELVSTDRMELAQAVIQVQKEAQERQATEVAPTSPEAQPGLALPGAGVEGRAPGDPDASLSRMRSLLGSLRLGQAATGPEQMAEASAQAAG